MITLYTPATGFPDLEIKIAYGLARVGIEAGYDFTIIPEKGYYRIEFYTYNFDKGKESFLMLLSRLLTSDRFFDLGVKAKDKGKYSVNEKNIKKFSNINFLNLYDFKRFSKLNNKKDYFCGHKDIPKFGGSSGLILISSFHAGKPYERDNRFTTFNQNLCAICGYLAVLGLNSFAFKIQLDSGKNKKFCIVLPVLLQNTNSAQMQILLSLQKRLNNFWLSNLLPLRTFTLSLLTKVPSICDFVKDLKLYFHLSLLSKDNRGDTVVEQISFINTFPFAKFISYSPFNSAAIDKLLGGYNSQPKVASLIEICNIIENFKTYDLTKFARLYVHETSTNNFINLLYPETARYLLMEVAMINPEIIENPALGSLARTLRFFIREKKYGYADDIRNARKESRDFEETIAKMLREGRLRLERKEMIHLPTDEEMKEVFNLLNKDFESTKLALVILAFSFPAGAEAVEVGPIEETQNAG